MQEISNRCKYLILISWAILLLPGSSLLAEDEDRPVEEYFSMSIEDLMSIEIETAGKKKEKVSDIPASVVIITREEIKRYGYTSYLDILQNVPGFYMIDSYFWLGQVNFGVRGFFSDGTFNDVIILVNGVNQMGDSYGDYPDSKINVPVEAIDRIEIIRGPMSVMYGSGAFMGAVNIITNEISNGELCNSAQVSYGSEETANLIVRSACKDGDFKYVLNASYTQSDGLDQPFSEFTNDEEYLISRGLSASSTTKGMLDNKRKFLNFNLEYKKLMIDFVHTDTETGIFDGMPSLGDGSSIDVSATNAFVKYSDKISEDITLTGKISMFHHEYHYMYEQLYPDSYSTNNVSTSAMEFEFNALINSFKNMDILLGYYQRIVDDFYKTYDYPIFKDEYTNTELYIPDDDYISTVAVFSQIQYNVSDHINLLGGIRLEQQQSYNMIASRANETDVHTKISGVFSNDDIKFIPRLALICSPLQDNIIKLLYGKAIKQASLAENFSQMLELEPSLEPAEITTYELNYIFSGITNTYLNFSVFWNELNHLIVKRNIFDNETQEWELFSSNRGEMQTLGFEVGIKSNPIENLQLDISATYQKTENIEPGFEDIQLGYAPEYLAYFKAAYYLPYNIILAWNMRYVGGMETYWENDPVDPDNGNLDPVGRIGNQIPSYFVNDLNIRLNDLLFDDFYLNLHISNIFDEAIRYPATKGNKWAVKGTPGHGRMFLIGLGYGF